ncbi:MAG TPA: ferredoxin [Armatimonadota bacterium]|jgi:ferredoxin
MKVRVDRELCKGAGSCVVIAPQVFQLDDMDKAVVIDHQGDSDATIWEAAESCPFDAIILEDESTGEWLYP